MLLLLFFFNLLTVVDITYFILGNFDKNKYLLFV